LGKHALGNLPRFSFGRLSWRPRQGRGSLRGLNFVNAHSAHRGRDEMSVDRGQSVVNVAARNDRS
jgi:hypothetical protein